MLDHLYPEDGAGLDAAAQLEVEVTAGADHITQWYLTIILPEHVDRGESLRHKAIIHLDLVVGTQEPRATGGLALIDHLLSHGVRAASHRTINSTRKGPQQNTGGLLEELAHHGG